MLLVQRIQDLRVSQCLIENLAGEHSRVVGQRDRGLSDGAELLYLGPALVEPRLAGHRPGVTVRARGGTGHARGRAPGTSRWTPGPTSRASCGGRGGTLGGQGISSGTAASAS